MSQNLQPKFQWRQKAIILLALFAQRYIFGQRYWESLRLKMKQMKHTPLNEKDTKYYQNSPMETTLSWLPKEENINIKLINQGQTFEFYQGTIQYNFLHLKTNWHTRPNREEIHFLCFIFFLILFDGSPNVKWIFLMHL